MFLRWNLINTVHYLDLASGLGIRKIIGTVVSSILGG
jgi:hypothetical protein